MLPDLWSLYARMLTSRLFEEAVARLWHDGLISGEMHLGTGEEGIVAGVVEHLAAGDAMALDHRGTAALLMRGVDPVRILRELLGQADGLCRGQGGHMHLFSPEHLSASSGIVGAQGPTAVGFALAAQYLKTGGVTVCFFGEGAMNQGMLLEAVNLASVWQLPVLFVCKDDGWSITTPSVEMTGGTLGDRVRGFGVPVVEADGRDVCAVWQAARRAVADARDGRGPTFLHARCVHFEGHFLGFQLLRIVRHPFREMPRIAGPLTRSLWLNGNLSMRERLQGLGTIVESVLATLRDPRRDPENDPVGRARAELQTQSDRLRALEEAIETETNRILAAALTEEAS